MVVKVPDSRVCRKYINQRLNELLESNVILEPKNGPIEYGDFVRLEYYVIDSQGNIIEKNELDCCRARSRPLIKALIGKSNGDLK